MYFEEPVKADRLSTPFGLSTSITLTTAALIVVTFAASIIMTALNPAAMSLFTALK